MVSLKFLKKVSLYWLGCPNHILIFYFSEVCVAQSLYYSFLCNVLSFFFLPLYCLSFLVLHPLIFKLCTQYFLLAIVLSVILRFTPSDLQTLHTVFSSCHCIVCPSLFYTLWSTNFAHSILFFEFLLHSILIVNYHLSMIKF